MPLFQPMIILLLTKSLGRRGRRKEEGGRGEDGRKEKDKKKRGGRQE